MRTAKLTFLMLLSYSVTANNVGSLHLLNASDEKFNVWVNGNKLEIDVDSALFFPCTEGERVELQKNGSIEYVDCGEVKEYK